MDDVCRQPAQSQVIPPIDSWGFLLCVFPVVSHTSCHYITVHTCLPACLLCLQTPLTRESHSSGVSLKEFYQNKELNEFFSPLSLSLDKEGKVGRAKREGRGWG